MINPVNFIKSPVFFEEWRPITKRSVPDVKEGCYLVSNLGRVYSNLRNTMLTPTITWNGYYRVCLRTESETSRYFLLHRIVLIEFNPVFDYQNLQANHQDGDKSHNSIENLNWKSCSGNITHAYRTGLKSQYHGEDCSWSTITNDQAEQIAQLISEQKYSQEEIAFIVNCPKHIVQNIATGSTWTWLYDKYNLGQYKRGFNLRLSDSELELLCKYFEDNKYKFSITTDLFKSALKDLFGIEFKQSMSGTLSRIYNHQTRKNITDKFNY